MMQTYVSGVSNVLDVCCMGFVLVMQKVNRDVVKVNRDVGHVAMAMYVCFKYMF
jgi:hypothetical protein